MTEIEWDAVNLTHAGTHRFSLSSSFFHNSLAAVTEEFGFPLPFVILPFLDRRIHFSTFDAELSKY